MYIILNYMHTEINRCLHPFWFPNQERNKSSLDGVLSHVTWRGLSEDAMQRYYLRVYSFTDQTNLSQVCLAFSLFYQRISSAFSYKKQVTGNESQYENRKEKHSQLYMLTSDLNNRKIFVCFTFSLKLSVQVHLLDLGLQGLDC